MPQQPEHFRRGGTSDPAHRRPVPRRPRRQPAATRRAARAPGPGTPPASSTPTRCAPSRTRRSATSSGMQEDVGLQSATDGEFRRTSWHMDFIYQLGGVDQHRREDDGALPQRRRASWTSSRPRCSVHDRIGLRRPSSATRSRSCETASPPALTPKLTIPSPSMVHYRGGRAAIDQDVYPELEQFWADLSAAYAEQVRRIADLGCTYLQLDDTSLAYLNDPAAAGDASPRRAATPSTSTSSTSARSTPPSPTARRAARHHAHVPRQLPLVLGRRGRLRLRRRGAVQRARRRRLLPRVRRRALRRLRAAALRAAGQAGRARPGHHQARRAGGQGRPQAPHRRGRASTSRSTSSACPRSAASPPPSRATCSRSTRRSPSCGWSSRPPPRSGASGALRASRSRASRGAILIPGFTPGSGKETS